MKLQKKDLIAYVCYFNICILWGTSNLATKIGVGGLSVTVFSGIRFFVTGVLALLIGIVTKAKRPKGLKEWTTILTVSLLMNFATNGLCVLGNKYADSGLVTVLFSAVPVFITVLDSIVLKNHRLGKRGWIGLTGGIFGIAFITFWGTGGVHGDLKGIIFTLMAASFWSIGSVFSKERVVHGSVVIHVAIEALFTSFLFVLTGNITHTFDLSTVTVPALIPAIYLAVVDSLIGFMSYICLLKVWKPSVVSTYAYINPVVALILGALILGEKITVGKVVGMVVIILSVILIQKDRVSGNDYKGVPSEK